MTGKLSLSEAAVDALAAARGDADTIDVLRAGFVSKNLLLVRAIAQTAAECCPGSYRRSGFEAGYTLLADVQRRSPATVTTVLRHPQTGTWAGACVRSLSAEPGDSDAMAVELGFLRVIAAAAAIRAGYEFETTVPLRDGSVQLPSLGRAVFTPTDATEAVVRHQAGHTTVTAGSVVVTLPADVRADAPGWQGLRQLVAESAGLRLELDLDDLGTYRADDRPRYERLDPATVAEWNRMLGAAWAILVDLDRAWAEAMTHGLVSIVPSAGDGHAQGSASSRDGFGAVIMTTPHEATWFAETLVHEFQHSKLNGLLDLVPLYEDVAGELYYSPARDDPRPLGGLLHGAYAYAGVADFWRRYRLAGHGDRTGYADLQFAMWREQVLRSSEVMLGSGRLSPVGARFVTGMRELARDWVDQDLITDQLAAAEDAADDHHLRWRINNLRPDQERLGELADAWLGSQPPPDPPVAFTFAPTPVFLRINPRLQLRHLRELNPERFAAVGESAATLREKVNGASTADHAYVCGEHETALARYRALLAEEPDNTEHWSGLALARRRHTDDEVSAVLVTRPELVHALHAELRRRGEHPDPEALAGWLAPSAHRTLATTSIGARP